jgi:hypothetical protein
LTLENGARQPMDIGNVRNAALGNNPHIRPSAALDLLVIMDGELDTKVQLLAEIIADRTIAPDTRTIAVLTLSTLDPKIAATRLSDLLLDEEIDTVAARMVTVIARHGDAQHIELVKQVVGRAVEPLLRRRASFANVLLAHRFRLPVDASDAYLQRVEVHPLATTDGRVTTMVATELHYPHAVTALRDLRRVVPWVYPTDMAYGFDCGPYSYVIVIGKEWMTEEGIRSLEEFPALVATVASRSIETGAYYPVYLVFADPSDSHYVRITVSRFAGEPAFAGAGRIYGSLLNISLHSVASTGHAAANIHASVSPEGLQLSGVSDIHVMPRRHPAKMPADIAQARDLGEG